MEETWGSPVPEHRVKTVRTVDELRGAVAAWRARGERIALVPTMGALHDGHLSLVREAKRLADRAVVSIFVNPTQFAPDEDFSRYPRDETGDLAKLAEASCDLVWAPDAAEMYPEGFATSVVPAGAALGLEADFRPHHFAGVATVCCKLFGAANPDIALFGEKDYQQLCVLRQMVRDLNLPLIIIGVPTVREPDGLALSSRNAYLSPEERRIAPELHRAIRDVAATVGGGGEIAETTRMAETRLLRAGFTKVDYVAVRDPDTLGAVPAKLDRPLRVLAAAWLGKTRLIDNVAA